MYSDYKSEINAKKFILKAGKTENWKLKRKPKLETKTIPKWSHATRSSPSSPGSPGLAYLTCKILGRLSTAYSQYTRYRLSCTWNHHLSSQNPLHAIRYLFSRLDQHLVSACDSTFFQDRNVLGDVSSQ